jgi:ABC-type protease/lipase transport system fused ATPase/permease subunit
VYDSFKNNLSKRQFILIGLASSGKVYGVYTNTFFISKEVKKNLHVNNEYSFLLSFIVSVPLFICSNFFITQFLSIVVVIVLAHCFLFVVVFVIVVVMVVVVVVVVAVVVAVARYRCCFDKPSACETEQNEEKH